MSRFNDFAAGGGLEVEGSVDVAAALIGSKPAPVFAGCAAGGGAAIPVAPPRMR